MDDVTKKLLVTFKDGLPMGTRGEFTYDGEPWIAYPRCKDKAIRAALDKLVCVNALCVKEMLRWINERPQDTGLVVRVLEHTTKASDVLRGLAIEKTEAVTM